MEGWGGDCRSERNETEQFSFFYSLLFSVCRSCVPCRKREVTGGPLSPQERSPTCKGDKRPRLEDKALVRLGEGCCGWLEGCELRSGDVATRKQTTASNLQRDPACTLNPSCRLIS